MNSSNELISQLDDYLRRRITLSELESWVAPRLPVLLDAPDSVVGRIAGAIELCVAELQAGLRTERTIRSSLRRYQEIQEIRWSSPLGDQPQDATTSASTTIPAAGLLSQLYVWSTEPEGASG